MAIITAQKPINTPPTIPNPTDNTTDNTTDTTDTTIHTDTTYDTLISSQAEWTGGPDEQEQSSMVTNTQPSSIVSDGSQIPKLTSNSKKKTIGDRFYKLFILRELPFHLNKRK